MSDTPLLRLHPLSPLLHSAKTLAVIVAAISWRGFAQLGLARWLVVVVAVLFGAVLLSVVSWLVTGYQVVGRELRVREGLLWRRSRAIPLDRLQAVDVVRPALARLVGLAELRLEVVGASKAEAPLAYLSVAEAAALRTRLLALSAAASAPAAEPVPAAHAVPATDAVPAGTVSVARAAHAAGTLAATAAEPERPVHRVVNQHVVVGQLLTPQAWLVPVGMAFVVLQFAFEGSRTFVGIASTITALVGVAVQPVRRVLDDWDFRISTAPAGLRLRHGLLDTRSQTVPLSRVQAVGVTWPLLWRPKHWLRCRIDVAGYGRPRARDEGGPANRLLPVGDLATARLVVSEVLPGVDVAALPLTRPPARARWLAPVRQPILAAGLTDRVFASVDGPLTRELVVVPFARIQSVRVVQGPLQRRLRLATVHADTAGGLHAVAHHRDVDEARALAAELAARARAARAVG
ncbi:MAG: PH domain-containing protein [Micromonosporaceae bacterium]|nr:PH domain-containing protein [Micromonosporaceae bacterium]